LSHQISLPTVAEDDDADDANYDPLNDAMSRLGMEEDDAYTISSRTTAFGQRSAHRAAVAATAAINQHYKIKSSPICSQSASEILLPTILVKWRTGNGKPFQCSDPPAFRQGPLENHKALHLRRRHNFELLHQDESIHGQGELAFPTYVLDQWLMTEEDYNWHCRLLKLHPKSILHIQSIKKVLGPEDLSSHWYRQDIILPYPVHQQLATQADGDEYFYGPTFVHYPKDGSWQLHLEMVALSDGYEVEESRQCPFVQVAHGAPQAQDAPQAPAAPPHVPAVVNHNQGIQQMEIDENNFDSAIHAGVAAAAASLPTPQNASHAGASQAVSTHRQYSQI